MISDEPTVGEVFAGIGVMSRAFGHAGADISWLVEVDKYKQAILKHQHPFIPILGDVHDVGKQNLSPVDILAGGFPCQDLSIANQSREGLEGSRSGLFFEFTRLIDELSPTWILIENVPGLLSYKHGRDMGIVLGELGKRGFSLGWAVLDSQWFGVAQRRRRVFIVGHRGKDREAPFRVLFEPDSRGRDSEPRRRTWEEVSGSFGRCPTCGRIPRKRLEYLPDVAYAVQGKGSKFGSGRHNQDTFVVTSEVEAIDVRNLREQPNNISGTLQAKHTGGHSLSYVNPIVVYPADICQCDGALDGVYTTKPVIRKLTPKECERLHGLPDDYTAWGDFNGKEKRISNTRRYTILGDAITLPVAEWLAKRIMAAARGNL